MGPVNARYFVQDMIILILLRHFEIKKIKVLHSTHKEEPTASIFVRMYRCVCTECVC
jgi:hypothetical protein